jgi:dihydrofolate reductase
MNCFIIAALSTDGYIAKDSNHAALWTSKEDKKRFIEITKRAGVVVMGLNTYKTLGRPLKERLNIIYAKPGELEVKADEKIEITSKPPRELLKELAERGFKEVAICGGSQIYTMFMESGIVNRLYLTIEPIIFGAGMKLFNKDMHYQLTLKSSGQTDSGALLLDYQVNHGGNHGL